MRTYTPPLCLHVFKEMNIQCQGSSTSPGQTLIPIDCDVDVVSCEENSAPSSTCVVLNDISLLTVDFVLVGSTSIETPHCTVTYEGHTYSDCEIPLVVVCDDGVYWQIRCENVPCGSTTPVTLECDGGVQEEPCENVSIIIL